MQMPSFRIDRRALGNFDWFTFLLVMSLSLIGVLTIYSATRPLPGAEHPTYYIRQLYWIGIGIAGMLLALKVDYTLLGRFAAPLYIVGLLFLLIVLIGGRIGMGAQRWISIGPISFQPSEFFRLVFIITVARYLSTIYGDMGLGTLIKAFFTLVAVPFILLLKQPDLGTASVMVIIFLFMCLSRGMARKAVTFIVIVGAVSVPFLGGIFWEGLKDYQKNRIIAFINPEVDPAGIGYHINQSKVTIGSGGFWGKGFMHGTQGPFRFLPEKHTDFIFSIFAEEWGFVGSVVLMLMYLFLFLRALGTAEAAKDPFGRMLAQGITIMFGVYFFFNLGMTMGLLPVVGIPMPFMSYGGTALLSNFIAIGLLINVRMRRFELFY